MPIKPTASETEEEFIGRCMSEEVPTYGTEQGYAICKSKWEADNMSKLSSPQDRVNAKFNSIRIKHSLIEKFEVQPQISSSYPGQGPTTASLEVEEGELNVLGYHTKNFDICPGAIELFTHLMTMPMDDDTIGMLRSAAQIADNVFHIEKLVIEKKSVTPHELEEAILLVDDFRDVLEEIDEEVGMSHDTSFMDGHIKTIQSFV
jgi:hypothetical protein